MRKIVSAIALSLLAQQASASFFDQWSLTRLANNPGNVTLQQDIQREVSESEKNSASWLNTWSSYEKQDEYGAAWSEIGLNLLRWSQPGKTYEWKSATRPEGIQTPVYQQDSLVDLERAQAYHLGYAKTTGVIHPYEIADTSSPQHELIATSQRRLAMGVAPIGPDNAPVKVCKIGRSSMAPYVELSETQRIEFTRVTELDFTSCLSGNIETKYWQARYHDFVDQRHDRTTNHNPGTSW